MTTLLNKRYWSDGAFWTVVEEHDPDFPAYCVTQNNAGDLTLGMRTLVERLVLETNQQAH